VAFERLPDRAVAVAGLGFTDCIATMIAGAHESAPQQLRQALAPAAGPAMLLFGGERCLPAEAALSP
jgi:2-methylcitrate dehydratase PrpD